MTRTQTDLLNNICDELDLSTDTLLDIVIEHFITQETGYKHLKAGISTLRALDTTHPGLYGRINTAYTGETISGP